MDKMNPVMLILGFFTTLFGGVGLWSFATALLTRKSDTHAQDASAIENLERASQSFREEVRRDNLALDAKIDGMKEAVWPLITTLDELLPKMLLCLSSDELLLLRDKVNTARMRM